MNKIPLGYMTPVLLSKGGQVLADLPVGAWQEGWLDTVKGLCTTLDTPFFELWEKAVQEGFPRVVEDEDDFISNMFMEVLQGRMPFKESKGPYINQGSSVFFKNHFDFRCWKDLEKEYSHFLVVPQYIWVEHRLDIFSRITQESIKDAGDEKLLECLQNGRAKMLIHIPWETGWWAHDNYSNWKGNLDRLGIPVENVIIIGPQSTNITEFCKKHYNGLRFLPFSNFERYPWDIDHMDQTKRGLKKLREYWLNDFRNNRKEKLFFCNINSPTEPRVFLYSILDSIIGPEKAFTNIANGYAFSEEHQKQVFQRALEMLQNRHYTDIKFQNYQKQLSNALEGYVACLPENRSMENTFGNRDWSVGQPWRHQCPIEIFAETRCLDLEDIYGGSECWFITEKTTKSLSSMTPFFALANKGYLGYLRSIGYETFGKWWDESYDECDFVVDRVLHILSEVDRISKMSESSLRVMLQDMESTLLHNFDVRAEKILSRDVEGYKLYRGLLPEGDTDFKESKKLQIV